MLLTPENMIPDAHALWMLAQNFDAQASNLTWHPMESIRKTVQPIPGMASQYLCRVICVKTLTVWLSAWNNGQWQSASPSGSPGRGTFPPRNRSDSNSPTGHKEVEKTKGRFSHEKVPGSTNSHRPSGGNCAGRGTFPRGAFSNFNIASFLLCGVSHPVPSGIPSGTGQSPHLVPKPLHDATKPPHWLKQTNSLYRIANTYWIMFTCLLHLMCTKTRNE